jgi:hypothetical protein
MKAAIQAKVVKMKTKLAASDKLVCSIAFYSFRCIVLSITGNRRRGIESPPRSPEERGEGTSKEDKESRSRDSKNKGGIGQTTGRKAGKAFRRHERLGTFL